MATKKCPLCFEKIQARALKCKHCGSSLVDDEKLASAKEKHAKGKGVDWVMAFVILTFVFLVFLGFIGSNARKQMATRQRHPGPAAEGDGRSEAPQPASGEECPAYTIINEDTVSGVKRSLDVRLEGRIDEGVLRSLAWKLRNSEDRPYARTFICYYLPGMTVDAGAWATTHFNPDLEVRFLGLTGEQEESLREQAKALSGDVIGTWLYEIPGAESSNRTFTIYREDEKLYLKTTYADGSGGTELVEENSHPEGRFFQTGKQAASESGEYFLLDAQGDLRYCDEEGCFATAKRKE